MRRHCIRFVQPNLGSGVISETFVSTKFSSAGLGDSPSNEYHIPSICARFSEFFYHPTGAQFAINSWQSVEIQETQHDGLFRTLHVHVGRDEFRVSGVAVRTLHLEVPASECLRDRSKHNHGMRWRWQDFRLQQRHLHMVLPEE
jgi:hypothetical protein